MAKVGENFVGVEVSGGQLIIYGRRRGKSPYPTRQTASATRMELAMQGFRGMQVGNRPQ